MTNTRTILVDCDGCILKWAGPNFATNPNPELLPGVKEKFSQWISNGDKIIITTGRKESDREQTVKQLQKLNLSYDILLCGLNGGIRILVNDLKPDGTITAVAVNLERDKGMEDIEI